MLTFYYICLGLVHLVLGAQWSPPPPTTTSEHLPPPDNVKFIFVGFRHGNRNPGNFFKDDTSYKQWAWEGASQLTNIGKRQAYTLGQFLRNRYGKLVPDEFYPAKVKAYSSSAERCQQTLQSCMAGFFPPKKGAPSGIRP